MCSFFNVPYHVTNINDRRYILGCKPLVCLIDLTVSYDDYEDSSRELSLSNNEAASNFASNISVTIHGNFCKDFTLATSYSVNRRTMLRFTLEIDKIEEGYEIYIDESTSTNTFSGTKVCCISIGGTQYKQWDDVMKIRDMPEAGQAKEIMEHDINIAVLFGYWDTTVKYLTIIQDNDTNSNMGRSIISSIALYDGDADDTTLFRVSKHYGRNKLCIELKHES